MWLSVKKGFIYVVILNNQKTEDRLNATLWRHPCSRNPRNETHCLVCVQSAVADVQSTRKPCSLKTVYLAPSTSQIGIGPVRSINEFLISASLDALAKSLAKVAAINSPWELWCFSAHTLVPYPSSWIGRSESLLGWQDGMPPSVKINDVFPDTKSDHTQSLGFRTRQ